MINKTSAGLLMYRRTADGLEVLLAHPGGPFFKHKNDGYWGLPKGEVEPQEDLLAAAQREFQEETGLLPQGCFLPLGSVLLPSGKTVHAWAFEGHWDETVPFHSNLFPLEWPPKSGNTAYFPEIDQIAFFPLVTARLKIAPGQAPFLERLDNLLAAGKPSIQ